MGIVTTVTSQSRLHLGYGVENALPNRLGRSIKKYTGLCSFFAKVFFKSVEIEINGRKHCVNRKSFIQHLESIGLQSSALKRAKRVGYAALINEAHIRPRLGNEKLGDLLTDKKRTKLLRQLVSAIDTDNIEIAKKLVRMGAYLNRPFWIASFWPDRVFMSSKHNFRCNVTSYTPLARAVVKDNKELVKFIATVKGGSFLMTAKWVILCVI
jgi:hypothetical protein